MDKKIENIFEYLVQAFVVVLASFVMCYIFVMVFAVMAMIASMALLVIVEFGIFLVPAALLYWGFSKINKSGKNDEEEIATNNDNSENDTFEEVEYTEPILKSLQESRILREKARISQEKQKARRIELLKSDKVSSIFKDYSNLKHDDFKTNPNDIPDYTWKRSDDG